MSKECVTYCRLCAETTPAEQLISCDDDVAINSEITMKMLWINIDISNANLPRSICFSCFDLLEKTWIFLQNVRSAQVKLLSLFLNIKTDQDCYSNEDDEPLLLKWLTDAGKPIDEDWDKSKIKKERLESSTKSAERKRLLSTEALGRTTEVKRESSKESLECNQEVKRESWTKSSETIHIEVNALPENSYDVSTIMQYNGNESSDFMESGILADKDLLQSEIVNKVTGKKERKKWYNYDAKQLDVSTLNISWDNYMCKCASCDEQCGNIAALQQHSKEIHSSCCSFKCLECDKVISGFIYFIMHVRVHNELLKYSCEYCNCQFPSLQLVKRHIIRIHKNVFSVICKYCGLRFETPQLLQEHIELYGKNYRKRTEELKRRINLFKCEICNKLLTSKLHLNNHRAIHTERSREFVCHSCGKMFLTEATLNQHMLSHTEDRNYKCDMCPKTFRQNLALRTHILWHNGEKPFVCNHCGRGFRNKGHLKEHAHTHTDLKPFTCKVCNKSFRLKPGLTVHLRQHTGERPYHCEYCQKDFTNFANFSKHNKRKHNKAKIDDNNGTTAMTNSTNDEKDECVRRNVDNSKVKEHLKKCNRKK